MTHRDNLNMSQAAELFYYEDAPIDLFMLMMDNGVEIDKAAEDTKKQLKKASENLKPVELDGLKKRHKDLLSEGKLIDDLEVKTIQVHIKILEEIWQEKYADAESNIMSKSVNVILKKITKSDLDILRKARRELVETEKNNKREVIVTNIFKLSHMAALRPLIQLEQK